jgi:hypothetical protein
MERIGKRSSNDWPAANGMDSPPTSLRAGVPLSIPGPTCPAGDPKWVFTFSTMGATGASTASSKARIAPRNRDSVGPCSKRAKSREDALRPNAPIACMLRTRRSCPYDGANRDSCRVGCAPAGKHRSCPASVSLREILHEKASARARACRGTLGVRAYKAAHPFLGYVQEVGSRGCSSHFAFGTGTSAGHPLGRSAALFTTCNMRENILDKHFARVATLGGRGSG